MATLDIVAVDPADQTTAANSADQATAANSADPATATISADQAMVTISAEYLRFLEELKIRDEARHCQVVTCVAIHDLSKLLVRPDAAALERTEFSEIFYDDVHIRCEPSKMKEIQQNLMDWYSKGSAFHNVDYNFACIYIGKYELESVEYKNLCGYYCWGLPSDYYININTSDKRTIYNIYTNLKQSGRLSDSDDIIQFMLED
jgi:hypothetical protein